MSTLTLDNLSVRLGDKAVLSGVSVAFAPGQVTAIVGPNGAGKSTLLGCAAGLIAPSQGRAVLDGEPLLAMPPRLRARRIAFLPQIAEVAWAIDARTLVGLGRTPHRAGTGSSAADDAAVEHALLEAGAVMLADRDVTTLSGGERARVLIARALAGAPEWLLADEPLTGLDPGFQVDVAELLRRMAHQMGGGVVVTLHDLAMAARLADRIVILAAGTVLAAGTPAQVLTPSLLARAYGIEAVVTDRAGRLTIDVIGRRA